MDLGLAISIGRETILHTLIISAPVLIVSLVIGLIVSIFQATTSIQEQTLTFVPKLIGIFIALIIFAPFIAQDLIGFTNKLFLLIPDMIR